MAPWFCQRPSRRSISSGGTPASSAASCTPGMRSRTSCSRRVPADSSVHGPLVDPAIVRDSAEDAVLAYLADLRSFDSTKGGLQLFIEQVAPRDVMDRLRAESARDAREAAWAEEWARLADVPEIGRGSRTARDLWPLLLGSQRRLTGDQWVLVESQFSLRPRGGRGRHPAPIRPILDAVIEWLRRGGRLQDLPSYPPDRTCSRYFRDWCRSGVLKDALDRLEAELLRVPRLRP
jgi:hypothetical protein